MVTPRPPGVRLGIVPVMPAVADSCSLAYPCAYACVSPRNGYDYYTYHSILRIIYIKRTLILTLRLRYAFIIQRLLQGRVNWMDAMEDSWTRRKAYTSMVRAFGVDLRA